MDSYRELWLPTLKAARVLGVSAKALRNLRDRKGGYLIQDRDYRYCWHHADGLEWNPKLCRIAIRQFRGATDEQRRQVLGRLKEKLQAEQRQQLEQSWQQPLIRQRKRRSSQEMHQEYLQRLRANSGINPTQSPQRRHER